MINNKYIAYYLIGYRYIPNGKDLMQTNTLAVILGKKTPQEAADALQDGLSQWFEPAQICLDKN